MSKRLMRIPDGVHATHWEGCWAEHAQCAEETVACLNTEITRLSANVCALERQLRDERALQPTPGHWYVSGDDGGRTWTSLGEFATLDEARVRIALERLRTELVRVVAGLPRVRPLCDTERRIAAEHPDHTGPCGVRPSSYELAGQMLDLLAKELLRDA